MTSKDKETKTTTIDILKFDVVKELCANRGISLKEFINMLVREWIMVNGGEYFTLRYFKGMAGRR